MSRENPFSNDPFLKKLDEEDKRNAEEIGEIISQHANERRIRQEIMDESTEVPEKIGEAVEEASAKYWDAFDEYVRRIRAGQKPKAPSRNMYIAQAQETADVDSFEEVATLKGYWGKLWEKAMATRNIPSDKSNPAETKRVLDEILYEGKIPEDLVIPE